MCTDQNLKQPPSNPPKVAQPQKRAAPNKQVAKQNTPFEAPDSLTQGAPPEKTHSYDVEGTATCYM